VSRVMICTANVPWPLAPPVNTGPGTGQSCFCSPRAAGLFLGPTTTRTGRDQAISIVFMRTTILPDAMYLGLLCPRALNLLRELGDAFLALLGAEFETQRGRNELRICGYRHTGISPRPPA
jgi:hypothetical protein